MKILIVSHDDPFTGRSGVASYCHGLESELLRRSVQIVHLCSDKRDWTFRPSLRWQARNGIILVSLVNSPVPPALSVDRPAQDCGHARVESLVAACLDRSRPDLLHVHAFQGLTASIVSLARRRGIPTVVTLHDFWPLCKRMLLIRPNGTLCQGPNGGVDCALFCTHVDPPGRRWYRRVRAMIPPGRGVRLLDQVRALYLGRAGASRTPWNAPGLIEPAQARPGDVSIHRARWASFLGQLNEADAVLAVSEFVRERFVRHAPELAGIRVLRLGVPRPLTSRRREGPHRPLRVGFLGRAVPLKGAHILASAARGIAPSDACFAFHGPANPGARSYLQALAGPTPLIFYGPFRREDLGRILDSLDVVVVPTLAQETVGLAAVEAHAGGLPVIASDIGAIPEVVHDGEDGFLVAPGDVEALRARILELIRRPDLIRDLSARITPPPTTAQHVDALIGIYRRTISGQVPALT